MPPLAEPVPVPVGAAVPPPVGAAPPDAEAGSLPVSDVPPESAPESAELEAALPSDADEFDEDVVELVVVVVFAPEAPTLAESPPGIVSVGAPAVLVVLEPPLPHAARPSASARPTISGISTALSRRVRRPMFPLLVADIAISRSRGAPFADRTKGSR